MDKKGQFFLIATVIIVGLIITVSTIYISTKTTKEDTTIYDLSKEINYESNQVLIHGVQKSEDISGYLDNLTAYYAATSPGTDILVVSGNEDKMSAMFYGEDPTGIVGVGTGTGVTSGEKLYTPTSSPLYASVDKQERNIRVWLNEQRSEYADFELKPGENFYLILQKQRGDETLVARE